MTIFRRCNLLTVWFLRRGEESERFSHNQTSSSGSVHAFLSDFYFLDSHDDCDQCYSGYDFIDIFCSASKVIFFGQDILYNTPTASLCVASYCTFQTWMSTEPGPDRHHRHHQQVPSHQEVQSGVLIKPHVSLKMGESEAPPSTSTLPFKVSKQTPVFKGFVYVPAWL